MTTNWIVYACLALGLSCTLVAGVFLAFSDFIMRGLVMAKAEGGMESMQHINKTVLRSVFLFTFLALVPASLALAVYAWFKLSGTGQTLIITAATIYLLSVFCVTVFGNVPMNERLAMMANNSVDAKSYWFKYARVWTGWNHIRTICATITATCLLLASTTFT